MRTPLKKFRFEVVSCVFVTFFFFQKNEVIFLLLPQFSFQKKNTFFLHKKMRTMQKGISIKPLSVPALVSKEEFFSVIYFFLKAAKQKKKEFPIPTSRILLTCLRYEGSDRK